MTGDFGEEASRHEGRRRESRRDARQDRRLVIRHRWYAGGLATLVSLALAFAGVSGPAYADATPAPTASPTAAADEKTPPADLEGKSAAPKADPTPSAEPSPSDSPTPTSIPTPSAEPSPSDTSTPTESATPAQEPSPDPSPSESGPGKLSRQAAIAPLAEEGVGIESVPDPGPTTAVITVKVGSDRTGITGVTNLAGVVLLLNGGGAGGPNGSRPDGVAGTADGWAKCVSDADGDCSFVVPNTQAGPPAGTNRDARYWIVQSSVPDGYYTNPNLRTGSNAGAGASTAYQFRTGAQLRAGATYSSQNADNFMLSSGSAVTASGGIWQQSRENPDLLPACGLRVALILDLSGSVADAVPQLKQAADTFVDALQGTPSQMSLFSFSYITPASGADANFPALTPVSTAAQGTAFKARYSAWSSAGWTNWDRGLGIAASSNTSANRFDIAVIITDGNPTAYNQPYQGSGAINRFREVENGVFSANALKAQGTRVIAFGVGSGATGVTNSLNLRAISGTTAYDGSNGGVADFYQTADYAAVGSALRDLALGNCLGTLTVTKQIVPFTAPPGSIAGALPAGEGWQFDSVVNTPGIDPVNDSQTTSADGTGTVTFPLEFEPGVEGGSVTETEVQHPGFELQPVNGQNAVCTNLNTGNPVALTGNPPNGFTVTVPSNAAVNCIVYNRAPNPEADVTVSKNWVVNGVAYENGAQPAGLTSQLSLTGPGAAGATPQGWGVTRVGYTVGDSTVLSEQVDLISDLCTGSAAVTSVNGSGTNTPLGDGYTLALPLQHNTATITNTVTCGSTLTLLKSVEGGAAAPTAWTLHAQNTDGAPITGFQGVTGVPATTNIPVTPDARYQLFESGGDPLYAQVDVRTALQSNPLSTGSATCIRVEADGTPTTGSGYSDGINGGVNVPLGYRVACTLVNQAAGLTLLKHVVNDDGGTAAAPAWTLTATPATLAGLSPSAVTGSETVVPASTFPVRPAHVYTLTESAVTGYQFSTLQQLVNGTWVDVVADPDPAGYPRQNEAGDWQIVVDGLDTPVFRFVNDDIAPTLTLLKTVTNDNGGSALPSAWTLTATTPGGPNLSGATATPAVTAVPVRAGTPYTIGETGPTGYTWDALSCTDRTGLTPLVPTLTLTVGENVTCTLHNDDQPGSLTLVKVVDNTAGGTAVPSDWNGNLHAQRGVDAILDYDTGETIAVPAGVYALTETGQLAGYELTDLVCTTGDTSLAQPTVAVANGSNVTCTFTNTAQQPTLTLEKEVVNTGGGTATADLWTLTASVGGVNAISGTGTPAGGLVASISGAVRGDTTYTLSETGPSGYTSTGVWACVVTGTATTVPVTGGNQVTTAVGQNVTCRIVNTAVPATGTVAKSVVSTVQNADGTWTILYRITVTDNSSTSTYTYDLVDELSFGGGLTPTAAAVVTVPAGAAAVAGWTGLAPNTSLASGVALTAAQHTHVWEIQVVSTVAPAVPDGDTWQCEPGDNPGAGGFLNTVTVSRPGHDTPDGTAHACSEPSFPQIVKTPGTPTQNADASWNVSYTVAVTNPGDVDIIATLTDAFPAIPAGWTLAGGVWTIAPQSGAPITNTTSAASPIWSGTLPAGTTYTYLVTGTVSADSAASAPIGACNPQTPTTGLINTATITSGTVSEDDDACVSIVSPPVTVVKTDGAVQQLADQTWQIDYTITVSNGGAQATIYTLTDLPDLGTGFTAESTSWVGTAPVANTPIAAGGSHQYVFRVIASFDPAIPDPELTCDETDGGAFFNTATVAFPGGTDSDSGCGEPASPTVTKTATAAAQSPAGEWLLSYTVTVRNDSEISLAYTLHDQPNVLPAGVTLTTPWAVTGPVKTPADSGDATLTAGWDGLAQPEVATGLLPAGTTHAYTVTAGVSLSLDVELPDLVCGDSSESGTGLWNTTSVSNGVGDDTDDACTSITPPPVTIAKSDGTISQQADQTWTIAYSVVVTNTSPTLATVYSLTDTPDFDSSFTVLTQGWQGSPDVTDVPIAGGASHTYVYVVTAAAATTPVAPSALTCTPADGGGFFNSATVEFPGGDASDTGCAVPVKPVVHKTAQASVQDTTTGLWTLSYQITVSNPTAVALAYAVSDTAGALPAGVTGGAWAASDPVTVGGGTFVRNAAWGGSGALATGTLPAGASHTYTASRTVSVAATVTDDALECGGVVGQGGGVWNTATVTNGIADDDSSDCATIERPTVGIEKTVTSTTQLVDGTWEITYDVVVTNASDSLAATYDLADTLVFGGDIVVDDASWTGPTGTGAFTAGAATLATGRLLAPATGGGGVETYTVTAHATVDQAAWDGDTLECQAGDRPGAGGFLNVATVTVNGEQIPAEDCSEPQLPTIAKAGVSAVQDPVDPDSWLVSYDVTVTSGGSATFYSLSDTPAFASGITLGAGTAQRTDLPAQPVLPITAGADFVTDVPLAAAGVHVYRVSWVATVTDAFDVDEETCTGEPGSGFFNGATLTVGDIPIDGTACIPVVDRVYPTTTKTVTSTVQDPASGDWTIRYDLVVSLAPAGPANPDGLAAKYDLDDALSFGGGIDVVSAQWSGQGSTDVAFEPDGTAQIASGRAIAAGATHTYTVTVVATVTKAAVDGDTTECLPGEQPGAGGFLNTAVLTSGGQETPVDACSEPVFPVIEKVPTTYTQNPAGTQTIGYSITVTYPDTDADPPAGVSYVLTDAPTLPSGVVLVGNWTAAAADADTPTPDSPSFNGSGTWTIVSAGFTPADVTAGRTVHTFSISATVNVTTPPTGEPEPCRDLEESGIVIWNEATITSGDYVDDDDACQVVHFDDVGLVKTSTLPDGETSVEPGDTFDYVLTVTNHGTRPAVGVHVTDDDLNDRLKITGLAVAPALTWGPAPGYVGNVVDLTIDSLAVGQSAVVTVTVEFLPPTIPTTIPEIVGNEPPPPITAPPLESLENTACVETALDPIGGAHDGPPSAPNCDDENVPTRDIAASVYTHCINDAPLIGWTIQKSSLLLADDIDVEWTPDGPAVPASVNLTQPGGTSEWSDQIVWPGITFTPSGVSINYPGWRAITAADIAGVGPDGQPQYFYPGASTIMTPEQQALYVFNGLIVDPNEPDAAWRFGTTIADNAVTTLRFSVNPELVYSVEYPDATPECAVARHSDVQIVKTASVSGSQPGASFSYTLAVQNISDDSAADGVVVTDAIPADLRITGVSWTGQADPATFPNWQTCAVSGQSAAGYGGTLRCVLFGPLQPAGSGIGPSAAPTITLAATVNPASGSSVITNVGVVDYYTFGDPDDAGRDTDDAVVTLSTLPPTGSSPLYPLIGIGLLAVGGGVATLFVIRRRRGEAEPRL